MGEYIEKCYICSSNFEPNTTICIQNKHIFQMDSEEKLWYTGRYPTKSNCTFVFPKGYLTHFMKMQCQLCMSSLDGLLEYNTFYSEPLKCIANGHESTLSTMTSNDTYVDVITVVDKGVKAHVMVP